MKALTEDEAPGGVVQSPCARLLSQVPGEGRQQLHAFIERQLSHWVEWRDSVRLVVLELLHSPEERQALLLRQLTGDAPLGRAAYALAAWQLARPSSEVGLPPDAWPSQWAN